MYPDPDASDPGAPHVEEFETWRSEPVPPTAGYGSAGAPIMKYDWEIPPGEARRPGLRGSRLAAFTAVSVAVAVAGAIYVTSNGGSSQAATPRTAATSGATGAPIPSPSLTAPPSPSLRPSTHAVPVANRQVTSHHQPVQTAPNRSTVHRQPPVVHHRPPRPRMCPVKDNGVIVAYVPC